MPNEIFENIKNSVLQGRGKKTAEFVKLALSENFLPEDILNNAILPGMDIVGDKFKNNEMFIPEVMMAARAVNSGVDLLKPLMSSNSQNLKGTVVIGTVKGDKHDIGKNLVCMMMRGKGINVIDLGVDVPCDKFIDSAVENNAGIICCSALLTTTVSQMKTVVDALKNKGLNDKIKVMIGGAPVTQEYCDKIGADAYSEDAASAASTA
ncbi:MAG: corrinoid protein, partial [Clostridia bacterium]|nr:corrinoid protein [Clostridia bacterium]